jgi:hypothetical protein
MKEIKANWYLHLKHAQLNEEQEESCRDELGCHNCDGKYSFNNHCGAHVCEDCDDHKGLARCYCGWSASGDDGYRELSEGGECPI